MAAAMRLEKQTLNDRQEKFVQNLFSGMTQRQAWINAGYSDRYVVAWIDSHACRLAHLDKIQTRLAELRKRVEDASVSTVLERRQILTEIQRAKIGEFVDENGNLAVDKAKLSSSAVGEIRTERTPIGVKTTLKLRDPVSAIAEHNKMDRIYSETPQGVTNNTQINIIVDSERGRELVKRLTEGNVSD